MLKPKGQHGRLRLGSEAISPQVRVATVLACQRSMAILAATAAVAAVAAEKKTALIASLKIS
jgi:hypothetical protein